MLRAKSQALSPNLASNRSTRVISTNIRTSTLKAIAWRESMSILGTVAPSWTTSQHKNLSQFNTTMLITSPVFSMTMSQGNKSSSSTTSSLSKSPGPTSKTSQSTMNILSSLLQSSPLEIQARQMKITIIYSFYHLIWKSTTYDCPYKMKSILLRKKTLQSLKNTVRQ